MLFYYLILVSVVGAQSDQFTSTLQETQSDQFTSTLQETQSDKFTSTLQETQSDQVTSTLQQIQNTLSTLNLRMARMENRQTTSELLYTRLENKINEMQKDQAQKHAETLLWHHNSVSLLAELKVKNEGLETQQKTMMSQLNRLVNNSDSCCHDNITVTCLTPTSIPTTQATTRTATPTTQSTTRPATSTTQPPTTTTPAQQDCKTVDQHGAFKDGVYKLAAGNQEIQVFCAGGYVTFQRRYNGQLKFDKTFSEYEQGFGSASSEHWLGLRYLHPMTKDKKCTFRARLAVDNTQHNKNYCGTQYAADCDGQVKEIVARDFRVSSADDVYRISVVLNKTDFLHPQVQDYFPYFNGQRFTTKDQDNDQAPGNCAMLGVLGGGFWYYRCEPGWPNSVYSSDKQHCSNSVCGAWSPYYISSTLLQFSC